MFRERSEIFHPKPNWRSGRIRCSKSLSPYSPDPLNLMSRRKGIEFCLVEPSWEVRANELLRMRNGGTDHKRDSPLQTLLRRPVYRSSSRGERVLRGRQSSRLPARPAERRALAGFRAIAGLATEASGRGDLNPRSPRPERGLRALLTCAFVLTSSIARIFD